MYQEAFAVLMRAFESDVLNFEGRFYNYKDYVIQVKPVQQPHPPIWYGAPHADAVAWAAPRAIPALARGRSATAITKNGRNLDAMAARFPA
jgi:alkanesulfonate monooxygenase SsuD/methylene tetrahydromethanopterin reductase-like flavin-dependent oxidoreductase (luciferase family)